MDFALKNEPAFELTKEKQDEINDLIKNDVKNLEVDLLKQILQENNIEFDNQLSNYQELKKHLKLTIDKKTLSKIENEENLARKELSEFIKEIQAGAPSTVKTILGDFSNKFTIPAAKTIATLGISRILFDAMLFLPCPIRTITGAVTLVGTKLISKVSYAKQKREEQSKQYNEIIDDLAKTRDKDGKVIEDHFITEQVEVIKKFFNKNGKTIETIPYSNMMNEIYSLKNKEKLELIGEISKSLNKKVNINKELSKGKRKKGLKSIVKKIEHTASVVGIGMLLSNLDKETACLALIPLPENIKHNMFKSRVTNGTQPKGLYTGMGIMGISTLITSGINAFKEKNKIYKKSLENSNKKFSTNQKLLFNIIKNKEIYSHPERAEEILKISTLGELKKYTSTLPLNEQKKQIDLTEDMNNIINKKDIKDSTKELGKMLLNSVSLAGKSMLLYQVLLHLQLIISPKKDPSPEIDPEPEYEPIPVSEKEKATSKVNNNEFIPQSEPELAPVPKYKPVQDLSSEPKIQPQPIPTTPELNVEDSTFDSIMLPKPSIPEISSQIESQISNSKESGILENIKKVAGISLIAYIAVKGLAGIGTYICPVIAPISVPIMIGG